MLGIVTEYCLNVSLASKLLIKFLYLGPNSCKDKNNLVTYSNENGILTMKLDLSYIKEETI